MSEIDHDLAMTMANFMRSRIKSWGYKVVRNYALYTYSFADTTEEETKAYKHFLDKYFLPRAIAAKKIKHRPHPPLKTYEGDTR